MTISILPLTGAKPLTEQDWRARGRQLGRTERALMWDIGEWWVAGEEHRFARPKPDSDEWKAEGWPAYQTCRNAGSVVRAFPVSRRRDNLSFNMHAEVAGIVEEDEADRLLSVAESDGLTVRDLRNRVRQVQRRVHTNSQQWPAGRYPLILADPPWRYEFSLTDTRAIENQYPTMELAEICGLDVLNLAADDAMLFLWVTNPKQAEGHEVLTAWGFEYLTNIVWVKDRMGMGYYARSQHEQLLIARRGFMPPPPESARPSSVVHAPRGEHSAKPDVFYELIEAMYPTLDKIELFSRRERAGWAHWGNQLIAAAS